MSWIDDVGFTVTGATAEANCQTLQTLHTEVENWVRRHASVFTLIKYELIHFTNRLRAHNTSAGLTLKASNISPSKTCQFLRVILNSQLDFKTHIQHIEVKAMMSLEGLAAIAGSTWGFSLRDLQRLYMAVILPQITYCCSV